MEQAYDTPPDDLWNACTDPERLPRWFEPITGDLREGGRYKLESSGTEGTVERCRPPSQLDITWEYEGDVSWVRVRIAAVGEGSRLTLEHSAPEDEYWRTYGPCSGGFGWDESFLALRLLLEGDERAAPEALQKMLATPEGSSFMDASLASWSSAYVEWGAGVEEAREAARRAGDFYRNLMDQA
nr:SRPBCC family protein [Kineosporia babensis]